MNYSLYYFRTLLNYTFLISSSLQIEVINIFSEKKKSLQISTNSFALPTISSQSNLSYRLVHLHKLHHAKKAPRVRTFSFNTRHFFKVLHWQRQTLLSLFDKFKLDLHWNGYCKVGLLVWFFCHSLQWRTASVLMVRSQFIQLVLAWGRTVMCLGIMCATTIPPLSRPRFWQMHSVGLHF